MDARVLEEIARREMAAHSLGGWTFHLTAAKRQLGACKYRLKRIEISEYHARHNPDETVLDTLRHEIAHALAGPAAKHGPAWKAIALRLGASPRACDVSTDTIVSPGVWQATCPSCRKTHHRYRTPKVLDGFRCRCEARSPLTFEYVGDPARRPEVPKTVEESARWEATCAGCRVVHRRFRRPKAGVWRCGCAGKNILTWVFRPA
jgi:hypothetical protein